MRKRGAASKRSETQPFLDRIPALAGAVQRRARYIAVRATVK